MQVSIRIRQEKFLLSGAIHLGALLWLFISPLYSQKLHITQIAVSPSGALILAGNEIGKNGNSQGFLQTNDKAKPYQIKMGGRNTRVNAMAINAEGDLILGGDFENGGKLNELSAWLQIRAAYGEGAPLDVKIEPNIRSIQLIIPVQKQFGQILLLCEADTAGHIILCSLTQEEKSASLTTISDIDIPAGKLQYAYVDSDSTFIVSIENDRGLPVLLQSNHAGETLFRQDTAFSGIYKINSIARSVRGQIMVVGSFQKSKHEAVDSWMRVLSAQGTIIKDTVWDERVNNWFSAVFEGEPGYFDVVRAIAGYPVTLEKTDIQFIRFDNQYNPVQKKVNTFAVSHRYSPVQIYRTFNNRINCVYTNALGSPDTHDLIEIKDLHGSAIARGEIRIDEKSGSIADQNRDGVLMPGEKAYLSFSVLKENDSWFTFNAQLSVKEGADYVMLDSKCTALLKKHKNLITIPIQIRESATLPKEGRFFVYIVSPEINGKLTISVEFGQRPPEEVPKIILSTKAFPLDAGNPSQKIECSISHKYKIKEVFILFEDGSTDECYLAASGNGISKYEYTIRVKDKRLKENGNNLIVHVEDEMGFKAIATITVDHKLPRGRLYVICIAPAYDDIQYNVNDAEEIDALLARQLNPNGLFESIIPIRCFKSPNNTITGIFSAFDKIKREYKRNMSESDLTVFFYSGHGDLDDEGNLELILTDVKADNERMKIPIRYEMILRYYINELPGKKLIILDACYSGSAQFADLQKNSGDAAVSARMNKNLIDFYKAKDGFCILSSSGPVKESYEKNELKNGVLTTAILEAFTFVSKEQEYLSFNRLFQYVKDRVPELNLHQRPQIIKNDFGALPLFYIKM